MSKYQKTRPFQFYIEDPAPCYDTITLRDGRRFTPFSGSWEKLDQALGYWKQHGEFWSKLGKKLHLFKWGMKIGHTIEDKVVVKMEED